MFQITNNILGVIKSVYGSLTKEYFLTLYYSLVYSDISQYIVICGGASENNIKPIHVVVDKIFRIIYMLNKMITIFQKLLLMSYTEVSLFQNSIRVYITTIYLN